MLGVGDGRKGRNKADYKKVAQGDLTDDRIVLCFDVILVIQICRCDKMIELYTHCTNINFPVSTLYYAYKIASIVSDSLPSYGRSSPGSSVHGIFRQEYWSGLSCPPLRDLPDPGIKPASLMSPAGGFVTTSATWGEITVPH